MTIADLRWRLRVWAWRLAILTLVALVPLAAGCELRRIKRDCISEISRATTIEQIDTLERICHLRIERR